MKGWLTVDRKREGTCSFCRKPGEHRGFRLNSAAKIPTPHLFILLCEACWEDPDKLETRPFEFSDSTEPAQLLLFYG